MGLMALNRLMSFQRERERRRRGQIRDATVALLANGKDANCQHDHRPQGQKKRYSGPDLPEDIWSLVHSLMPLRDAARSACVSRSFLCSWRCRPDITFSRETLGLNKNLHGEDAAKDFNSKVDHILRNRSGTGLRTLKIKFCGYSADTYSYLNSWLEIAITPQLEELTLWQRPNKVEVEYSFPCSLLSKGSGNSIRHLSLDCCAFNTTVGLDCLKNLTSLRLRNVRITRDELGCLLSSSFALEKLELSNCRGIVCLMIPCLLQRLSSLKVSRCERLKRIEINAPNISSFHFTGDGVQLTLGESSSQLKDVGLYRVQLTLGESALRVKDLGLVMDCPIPFAFDKLPSLVPNLETLYLNSTFNVSNTPMVSGRFLHLKHLSISLTGEFSSHYDCFCTASFLQAAPSLERLVLTLTQIRAESDPSVGVSWAPRRTAGTCHNNLKSVEIIGFYAVKSFVELTCYILESATSLERLTIDPTWGWGSFGRCSDHTLCRRAPWSRHMIKRSQDALLVIGACIEGKVPPSVKFNFLGHCSLCHSVEEL